MAINFKHILKEEIDSDELRDFLTKLPLTQSKNSIVDDFVNAISNAVVDNDKKPLAAILKTYPELQELIIAQFKKEAGSFIQGDKVTVYRGLFAPPNTYAYEVVAPLKKGDNINLMAKGNPYQGFTPEYEIAWNFSCGAGSGDGRRTDLDFISVIVESTIDINSMMYYWDFIPWSWFKRLRNEMEIIVDMNKANAISTIDMVYFHSTENKGLIRDYDFLVGYFGKGNLTIGELFDMYLKDEAENA